MATQQTPARVLAFEDLDFVPRFEHGEMAQLAEVSGSKDGTRLGVGFGRMTKARIDWTPRYDEVLIVIEGHLRVRLADGVLEAGPKDSIWLPKGIALTYEAEDALIAYAIHPADWQDPAS